MIDKEKTGCDSAENATIGTTTKKICSRCCMDTTAEEITFDKKGICNFCHQAQQSLKEAEAEKENLPKIIKQVVHDGKGKEYDCLIGLSGGVDSTTTLHELVKMGLRPLCFSMDNGYNDPIADENVLKIVEELKLPYERRPIDIDKYKHLQAAFIQAGVKNVEIPTDHILMAMSLELASKYGIKWIFSGGNVATESIMPPSWGYNARDLRHIKDIYKKMTGKRLKGLPMCGLLKWNYYRWIKRIKTFYLLDYINYNREESQQMLKKNYRYVSTGEKHEENLFTKWFQNWYLPTKFGIDKRKAHFSSLINSGQMTKKEAEKKIKKKLEYEKFGLEDQILKFEKYSHDDYKKDEKIWNFMANIVRVLRKPYRILTKTGKNIKA